MKTSTTPPLPLIAKIAIALTFINTWVLFEETVVDRHGLWRYMPFYRVGLFCVWDAAVLAVTLLLFLANVLPLRRRDGTQSTTPPLPLIATIAIAMTFLSTLVIFFLWPGILLRVCFWSVVHAFFNATARRPPSSSPVFYFSLFTFYFLLRGGTSAAALPDRREMNLQFVTGIEHEDRAE